MKKLVIPILFLAAAGLAFPQNKKGNLLIGTYLGSTGLSFGNSESGSSSSDNVYKSDNSGFNIGVGPSIGYFLTDSLVVGASLGISYSSNRYEGSETKTDYSSNSNSSSIYLSLGPFLRYYLGSSNPNRVPYVHLSVGTSLYPSYSGHYETGDGYEYDYSYKSYSSWGAGLQLGYEHFLNPSIGLQYYVGYSFSHYSYETEYDYETGEDYSYNYKNNSHGLSVGIGIQIHLDWLNRNR